MGLELDILDGCLLEDKDKNILCIVSINRGRMFCQLYDEYYFYKNGTIKRVYDQDYDNLNLEVFVEPTEISDDLKFAIRNELCSRAGIDEGLEAKIYDILKLDKGR